MTPAFALLSLAAILVALDLIVLRLILRKKVGHWLLTAAALCIVASLVLLFLLPSRQAY